MLALGSGGPTFAQSDTGATEASPGARRAAIELFKQSRTAYQAGRFKQAAELLKRAYGLDPAPTLLYNLARALESDGDLDGAIHAYRRYLEADPGAKDRAAIEKRIANLDAQIAEREDLQRRLDAEKARKSAAPAQAVTVAPPPSRPSAVPWVVAGTGAAGLVAGAVLGGIAQSKHGQADDAANMADAVELDDQARGLARGANIAFIAGGAIAAAGVVWGIIDVVSSDDAPDDEASVRVAPAITPNGVAVVGRF